MPRFRSQGQLDDPALVDGDSGFVGMNQRERPNQLKPGEVVLSKNGRIDGHWQPRRGIALKSGQLATSELPLYVPFVVLDATIAISSASRTSNVVTINLASAHNIDSGDTPVWVTLGDPAVATAPITGIPAGAYLMTYVDADSLSFANTGADDPALVIHGTYGVIDSVIFDAAVSDIYGSCVWSDPTSDLEEFAIIATNGEAKAISLDDYAVTSIPYPAGGIVSANVDMIQAFDRIFLFRDGERTWEYIPKGRSISAASYVSATGIVTVTLTQHGLTVGDAITVADVGYVTTDPNGTHTVSAVTGANTFQYVIASGGGNETYTANTGTMTADGFTKVPAGAYTQPQQFRIAGNAYGVASGSLRLTVSGNTTIEAGDWITIAATDVPLLESLEGIELYVTSATSTDIYCAAPVADLTYGTGSGAQYIEFGGRFSKGLGFIYMPAPKWGVYFQRRLWCPYNYNQSGTGASPTYTDRGNRDEIVASDILDSATFDSVASQFRITAGIADALVGVHPFYEDNLIVFNRNSLHMISGTQGGLGDTVVKELTREVGCLARRSIVSQGSNVFFLSDGGVYGLNFIDAYNLRGVEEPLSVTIQPYIDRLNSNLADQAVGIFFDNRYYLAVPLDSEVGAGDAGGNNSVLVYNILNKAWESVDTYGDNDFFIINFLVGKAGERNELYVVNSTGGLHLTDANDAGQDDYSVNSLGSSTSAGIDYELQTRGYGFDSLERKKFRRAQVQLQSSVDNASDVAFRFASEDPDTTDFEVTDVASLLDVSIGLPGQLPARESGNFRFRLGNPRGIYGVLTIKRKIVGSSAIGRPRVTSVVVEAGTTNRQTLTQY